MKISTGLPKIGTAAGVLGQGNRSLVVAKDDWRSGQRIAKFTKKLAKEDCLVERGAERKVLGLCGQLSYPGLHLG